MVEVVGNLSDGSMDEPDVVDGYCEHRNGSFEHFKLVGHGRVTNSKCGSFKTFWGCNRRELHDHVGLDGVNYKDKGYFKPVFLSCDKPSCPVCYKYGWASREAHKIEVRLAEGARLYGHVEHIGVTIPPEFYNLSYADLRKKVLDLCMRLGIIGGCLIFHGFRYNERKEWYWSPHFHVLGFVQGGVACHHCKVKCFKGCGGFRDKCYRLFEQDRCIVDCYGERKTVGGTAWYQLNHAAVLTDVKRFHVVTWFGCCSYRRLKVLLRPRDRSALFVPMI